MSKRRPGSTGLSIPFPSKLSVPEIHRPSLDSNLETDNHPSARRLGRLFTDRKGLKPQVVLLRPRRVGEACRLLTIGQLRGQMTSLTSIHCNSLNIFADPLRSIDYRFFLALMQPAYSTPRSAGPIIEGRA